MFEDEPWFLYLTEEMQKLLQLSYDLMTLERQNGAKRYDYGYLIFPAAKAYEGFLKKYLLDLGLISEDQYRGKEFRIGRSLNPILPKKFRGDDWLYDDLVGLCGGRLSEELPMRLWKTWQDGRNSIFHYFNDEMKPVEIERANEILDEIVATIKMAVDCQREFDKKTN